MLFSQYPILFFFSSNSNNNIIIILPLDGENEAIAMHNLTDEIIIEEEAREEPENLENSLENEIITDTETRRNVRKVLRNESKWKCNERKRKHQAGEAYLSKRNKFVPAKKVLNKKDCLNKCKFKCSNQITTTMREDLFKSYYKLNQNEKHFYLTRVTKRVPKKRSTKTINCDNEENVSHRQYSFIYNFPVKGEMIRVCKEFFLGTLSISQKPVYNAHASKDANEITKKDGRGKSITSSRRISRDHVKVIWNLFASKLKSST